MIKSPFFAVIIDLHDYHGQRDSQDCPPACPVSIPKPAVKEQELSNEHLQAFFHENGPDDILHHKVISQML